MTSGNFIVPKRLTFSVGFCIIENRGYTQADTCTSMCAGGQFPAPMHSEWMGGDKMDNYVTFGDLLQTAEFCVSLALLLATVYYYHKKK